MTVPEAEFDAPATRTVHQGCAALRTQKNRLTSAYYMMVPEAGLDAPVTRTVHHGCALLRIQKNRHEVGLLHDGTRGRT